LRERFDHFLTVARWNEFVAVVMKDSDGDIFRVAKTFRFLFIVIRWEIPAYLKSCETWHFEFG